MNMGKYYLKRRTQRLYTERKTCSYVLFNNCNITVFYQGV